MTSSLIAQSSPFVRPLDCLAADQAPARSLMNIANYGNRHWDFATYPGVGYGRVNYPSSTGFATTSYSYPIYACTNADPKQKIGLWSGSPPYPLGAQYGDLQSHLLAVPIPDRARCPGIAAASDIPADGTEHACVIWNRDSDECWELFWMSSAGPLSMQQRMGYMWTARYGGYIPSLTAFSGMFPHLWGARATSLGALAGLITLQDLRDVNAGGGIRHAIAIASPNNAGAGTQIAPATRSDGASPAGNLVASIPPGFPGAGQPNPAYHQDVTREGTRYTFPAGADLSSCTHPVARAIAEAIRDYGMIIADTSASLCFYIEDPKTLRSPYHLQGDSAVNPWGLPWGSDRMLWTGQSGWSPVTAQLPWGELQVLAAVSA